MASSSNGSVPCSPDAKRQRLVDGSAAVGPSSSSAPLPAASIGQKVDLSPLTVDGAPAWSDPPADWAKRSEQVRTLKPFGHFSNRNEHGQHRMERRTKMYGEYRIDFYHCACTSWGDQNGDPHKAYFGIVKNGKGPREDPRFFCRLPADPTEKIIEGDWYRRRFPMISTLPAPLRSCKHLVTLRGAEAERARVEEAEDLLVEIEERMKKEQVAWEKENPPPDGAERDQAARERRASSAGAGGGEGEEKKFSSVELLKTLMGVPILGAEKTDKIQAGVEVMLRAGVGVGELIKKGSKVDKKSRSVYTVESVDDKTAFAVLTGMVVERVDLHKLAQDGEYVRLSEDVGFPGHRADSKYKLVKVDEAKGAGTLVGGEARVEVGKLITTGAQRLLDSPNRRRPTTKAAAKAKAKAAPVPSSKLLSSSIQGKAKDEAIPAKNEPDANPVAPGSELTLTADDLVARVHDALLRENYQDGKAFARALSPQTLFEIVQRYLVSIPPAGYPTSTRGNCNTDSQRFFTLGLVNRRKPVNGGFVKTFQSEMHRTTARHMTILINILTNVVAESQPDAWKLWASTSFGVNFDWKCQIHVDGNNLGESMGISLGNFTGGELQLLDDSDEGKGEKWRAVEYFHTNGLTRAAVRKPGVPHRFVPHDPPEGGRDEDCSPEPAQSCEIPVKLVASRNKAVPFDGRQLHGTEDWEGQRIAVIAYPSSSVTKMADGTQEVLESFGFERVANAHKKGNKGGGALVNGENFEEGDIERE